MPGPRPKPDELKALAGNPGHRPLNLDAPKPAQGIPEMPRGLSPAGRREFKYICGQLLSMGLMYRTDGKAIAAYCDAYSMVEQADKEIKKYGLMFETKYLDSEGDLQLGDLKKNPAVDIKFKAMATMHKFLIEFGLTPASRSRLKIEAPKVADPMEVLLTRKAKQALAAAKENAPLHFDVGVVKPKDIGTTAIAEADTNFDA